MPLSDSAWGVLAYLSHLYEPRRAARSKWTGQGAGGYNGCQMKNCRIRYSLAQSVSRASRPNQVWSLIHWVMHNLPERMSVEQVQASKAIALILKDNFWCNDCRGLFTIGVLGAVGYPPVERNGTRHADAHAAVRAHHGCPTVTIGSQTHVSKGHAILSRSMLQLKLVCVRGRGFGWHWTHFW